MTTITAPNANGSVTSLAAGSRRRLQRRELRALLDVLRSERIKLSTVRTAKVLLVLTIAIDFIAAYATARLVTDEVLTVSQVLVYPAVFTAVFAAISGIVMFTSEVQHGTLGVTLAVRPARWMIVAVKALVAIAVGVTLGVAGMAAAAGGAALGGLALGGVSAMAATAAWALLYTSTAATMGLGVGMIARHSAGAISGLLVWWFVAENLLRTFTPPTIGRFLLPFDAGYRTLGVGSKFDNPEILAAALRAPQYALIFGAYAVLTLAVGAVLLNRRDVN